MRESAALPPLGVIRLIIRATRSLVYADYLTGYKRNTGMRQADTDAWLVPVAAMRLAVGIGQERQRLLDMIDNAPDANQ